MSPVRSTLGKRFFVETWGCQMNELDSQRMTGQLMQEGFLPTKEASEADVILLNSCSVREKAEHKVFSRLGEYRLLKKDKPDLVIGLCGCVAQQVGQAALDRIPELDFVLGPARTGELHEIIDRRRNGERVVATGFPKNRVFDIDTISRDGQYKGMVTIVEGCDKKCTFCIVPSTRGPEFSRSKDEILNEVRHLRDFGFKEIELLGQTVNHWKDPATGEDFAVLLDAVATIPGIERLRFITSYPRDFTAEMVRQFAMHQNICPYLHLPVQSGSDRVLKRMGRGYTIEVYKKLTAELRMARPGIALSTDIIVGFPGETATDFRKTLSLLEEIQFSSIYAFKYSPRPGTAALHLSDECDPSVADERLQTLFRLQEGIQRRINQSLVGTTHQLVVTGWGREPGTQIGRTPCHRVVHFPVKDQHVSLGDLTSVRIEHANTHSLMGSPA